MGYVKLFEMNHFKNEKPNKTQMTSMLWINERNNSLLLTGCDDGSVRLWDKIIASDSTIRSGNRIPATTLALERQPPYSNSPPIENCRHLHHLPNVGL